MLIIVLVFSFFLVSEHLNKGKSIDGILSKRAEISSVKYDMIIKYDGFSFTAKVWEKNNKSRIEISSPFETVYIEDRDLGKAYVYYPTLEVAFEASELNISEGQIPESATKYIEKMENYDPKVIGTEKIEGKDSIIIEYVAEGMETKIWIWKDKGFPLRIESINPETGGKAIIEFKNIEFVDIPDTMFEIPEEAREKIEEIQKTYQEFLKGIGTINE